MRKIFLTSGLILCMACPAFAEGEGFTPTEINTGTVDQTTGTITVANGCVHDNLGVYSGSTTLKAIWNGAYDTITLNSDLADGGATAGAPGALYATGGSLYPDTEFTTALTTGDQIFTTTQPVGDSVTYTLNFNDGGGSTSVSNSTAVENSVVPGTRTLNGFYDENDVQMIDGDGLLTSNATNISGSQTWTASWGGGTPSVDVTPTRDGYTFVRWDLNTDDTVDAPVNITQDTTVYAIWAPRAYTIEYNCDTENGGHGAQRTATVYFDTQFNWAGNADATQCGKVGSHFTGWTCTSGNTTFVTNGGVTQHVENNEDVPHVFDGTAVTPTGSDWLDLANDAVISCTAQYAANGIGLTFDYDNGSADTTGSCTYGDQIVLPETPTKRGYTFGGWRVVSEDADEDDSLYNGD